MHQEEIPVELFSLYLENSILKSVKKESYNVTEISKDRLNISTTFNRQCRILGIKGRCSKKKIYDKRNLELHLANTV